MRVDAGAIEHLAQRTQEAAAPKLLARDVHRHGQRRQPLGLPGAALCTCGAQYPVAHRHDQAGVFGNLDKPPGHQQAQLPMLPAHQRFEAGDGAGLERDDRLVMQYELVALDGAPQRGLDRQALQRPRIHRLAVKGEVVPPFLLRVVHRRVGRLDQAIGAVCVVGIDRDTDARTHDRLVLEQRKGFDKGVEHARRHLRRALGRIELTQHDAELVAAQTRERHRVACWRERDAVLAAHTAIEAVGDRAQQLVAHDVAQRVVDALEAVDVEQHHREHLAAPTRPRQGAVELLVEPGPVGQARQAVVVRQVPHPFFGLAPFGHVLHGALHQCKAPALARSGLGSNLHHPHTAVRTRERLLFLEAAAGARHAEQAAPQPLAVTFGHARKECREGRHVLCLSVNQDAARLDRALQLVVLGIPVPTAQSGHALCVGHATAARFHVGKGARRTQDVADAVRQDFPVDGLGDEVGGARLVSATDRGRVVVAGEHDDGHIASARQ